MTIWKLSNPAAFKIEGLRTLAERACQECGVSMVTGPDYIAGMCGHWNTCVIAGLEQEEPVALMIAELPTPFMLHPSIPLAYNRGSTELGAEMFMILREFVQGSGYTRVQMQNQSRARDDVWARGCEIRLRAKEVKRTSGIILELQQDGREPK